MPSSIVAKAPSSPEADRYTDHSLKEPFRIQSRMVFGALVLRRSTSKAPNVQNGMDLHGIPHGDTWSSMSNSMELYGVTCTSI